MQQAVYLTLSSVLLLAIPASGLLWFRLIARHRSHSVTGFLDSLLPARPRERPFWSPVDVLIMMGSMIMLGQLLLMWMLSQGWIQTASPELASVPVELIPSDLPADLDTVDAVAGPQESSAGESAVDPSALDPTSDDPSAADSTAIDPTAIDPTAIDPTAIDPTAIDPTAIDPSSDDSSSADQRPLPTQIGLVATIAANALAGAASMGIALAWLGLFSSNPARRLGLVFRVEEVRLGLVAALLILPLVLLVSAAATLLREYEHPVLTSLSQISTPAVFIATFIGTAIVTPVVEEFMVRGLLQGGLQGLADRRASSEGVAGQAGEESGPDLDTTWTPTAWWPLLVASLLFALLHLGQGAAPIPLFVLSLGLGYLYRQTGSLAAPIVVHMILNGLTITIEVLKP